MSHRAVRRRRALSGLMLAAVVSWGSSALASSGGAGLVRPGSNGSSASPGAVFARTLRMGQSGSDIKRLQSWLSALGYNVGVTGYFGSATKSAVRLFQRAHRLHPASGSVGRRTASGLQAALRRTSHAPRRSTRPLDPIPGFRIGRDDMGVDASAHPGAAIYAPLASRLEQVMRDWYAGQPLLLFRFVHHPAGAASNYWYVAEQVDPVTTRIGTVFHAGERVASFASSGTDIEIGWGSPTSWTRTLAGATDPGAAHPSGSTTRWGESFKQFFGIR